ncbi:hypothetical protein Tsubulata_033090 [Turnera subulata]|uniref:DUF7054 domain-containing protein n=1 Tax=Turnera subulata TaxID=218843 RepID=A0A9Q0F4W1_9ROSI|nr:hypothetical protein Tsubulata_033090 [Turnera subulata]
MKRDVSEKNMLQVKQKKKVYDKKNRFLIIINVLGSAGPIRFVVNGDDLVGTVIETALKTYAREGRLPVLGFDVDKFVLYPANAASDALDPRETIGSRGGRNFVLCKNQQVQAQMTEGRPDAMKIAHKASGWKAWLNKSLSFKVSTH